MTTRAHTHARTHARTHTRTNIRTEVVEELEGAHEGLGGGGVHEVEVHQVVDALRGTRGSL